jgi:pSer/pThr/pTyr-binding forkhead associated (FHA) protein
MNSRNGTMINGVRIDPIKEKRIRNGDRIALGNEEFIFYCSNTD